MMITGVIVLSQKRCRFSIFREIIANRFLSFPRISPEGGGSCARLLVGGGPGTYELSSHVRRNRAAWRRRQQELEELVSELASDRRWTRPNPCGSSTLVENYVDGPVVITRDPSLLR